SEVDQLFLEVARHIARRGAAALDLAHGHAGKALDLHELVAQGNQLVGADAGFDFFHASASFSSNQRYSVGNTTRVSKVEVTRPPMTTMASGRCTSDPGPSENRKGIRPSIATVAVITTGRKRWRTPSVTASRTLMPSLRRLRM